MSLSRPILYGWITRFRDPVTNFNRLIIYRKNYAGLYRVVWHYIVTCFNVNDRFNARAVLWTAMLIMGVIQAHIYYCVSRHAREQFKAQNIFRKYEDELNRLC